MDLHLLDPTALPKNLPSYAGPRSPSVQKVTWVDDEVWLEAPAHERESHELEQSGRFQGVSADVWTFHMAGYQVCEKWLKERKGRRLSSQEITTFREILGAVRETIRLVSEIDSVIVASGGWPGAFPPMEPQVEAMGMGEPKVRDLNEYGSED